MHLGARRTDYCKSSRIRGYQQSIRVVVPPTRDKARRRYVENSIKVNQGDFYEKVTALRQPDSGISDNKLSKACQLSCFMY